MTSVNLVGQLFEGPLDIVGYVHGEIEALRQLIDQLGYDAHGQHSDGRRLVFVGDLGDRGPDSPAVGELVMSLVDRGLAQCVLGNHELNLLRNDLKAGNAWFIDPNKKEQQPGGEFAHCKIATEEFKTRYRSFLAGLPFAFERSDMRVVHAAWVPGEINALRTALGSTLEVYEKFEAQTNASLRMEGLQERAAVEKRKWKDRLRDRHATVELLTASGECDARRQMGNPVRVATSGPERLAAAPFWATAEWRMCDRVRWWQEYEEEVPVVVGHYWRRMKAIHGSEHAESKPDLFDGVGATDWMGPKQNVFCVDYSVGARYEERKAGKAQFDTHLAAMRWPERELWVETGRVV